MGSGPVEKWSYTLSGNRGWYSLTEFIRDMSSYTPLARFFSLFTFILHDFAEVKEWTFGIPKNLGKWIRCSRCEFSLFTFRKLSVVGYERKIRRDISVKIPHASYTLREALTSVFVRVTAWAWKLDFSHPVEKYTLRNVGTLTWFTLR